MHKVTVLGHTSSHSKPQTELAGFLRTWLSLYSQGVSTHIMFGRHFEGVTGDILSENAKWFFLGKNPRCALSTANSCNHDGPYANLIQY